MNLDKVRDYCFVCDCYSEERDEVLEALTCRANEKEKMVLELQAYKENDPEVLEAIKQETSVAHEAANRWTGMGYVVYLVLDTSQILIYPCSYNIAIV